ncbi:hypothetical protein STAFG_2780 [Streptomyces afghaniensis 772]|uniref:Uncharacterized protein n=1 Tax=Streptomyces afghaniensis 772 TaxID=1283301 RepID=S4MWC6_9ACTN|nr:MULTISPECIES: hypothetical protein [Streptomyces]EPJ40155.1 hypothetical protein STAFG_2780 [Streptomyces afghaniensis 772]UOB08336.1 hypothetical protein MQE23_04365 [Streptomyces sp. HP-A2021]
MSLQARSLAALATTTDQPLGPGVQAVPASIDRGVATDLVAMLSRI